MAGDRIRLLSEDEIRDNQVIPKCCRRGDAGDGIIVRSNCADPGRTGGFEKKAKCIRIGVVGLVLTMR